MCFWVERLVLLLQPVAVEHVSKILLKMEVTGANIADDSNSNLTELICVR